MVMQCEFVFTVVLVSSAGLKEDLLAFRLSFVGNESLFFRAAKPNQRNTWIQTLEKVRHIFSL